MATLIVINKTRREYLAIEDDGDTRMSWVCDMAGKLGWNLEDTFITFDNEDGDVVNDYNGFDVTDDYLWPFSDNTDDSEGEDVPIPEYVNGVTWKTHFKVNISKNELVSDLHMAFIQELRKRTAATNNEVAVSDMAALFRSMRAEFAAKVRDVKPAKKAKVDA